VDYTVNPHGIVSPDVLAHGIVITVDIGRKSRDCMGFGVCSITIETLASERAVPTAATWNNGRLQLSFLAEPPDKDKVLTIDEDIVLDSATARALGYEHLTVRAGQYPVDYTVNPHGIVSPDVMAHGIIITVDIGRKLYDCTRFGICSVTIEALASDRAIPASAAWVNGRLQLNFLAEPPDKIRVLTIDEDIVLDSATARALGYEQLTVQAGQYPMDYTVNPHGQVSLEAFGALMSISRNASGGITISWPNSGYILEEASNVIGPWMVSPAQTSPLIVIPNEARRYYRVVTTK
jgi:hypothetical protein